MFYIKFFNSFTFFINAVYSDLEAQLITNLAISFLLFIASSICVELTVAVVSAINFSDATSPSPMSTFLPRS